MKIIVLGTRGFPHVQGGIEKHCEELYTRLAALGCDVTVISRAPYTGLAPYEYRGVSIVPIACPKHKFLETISHTFLGIIKAKQLNGDILHIHAIGPALFTPMARLLGLRVVMTHHGPDYDRKKWNSFAKVILKLGEKLGATFAHQVIAISQPIAQAICQKFGRPVTVIPNGVVVRQRSAQDDVLKKNKLERGKYILSVGRFVPEKGFHELIDSFQEFVAMAPHRQDGWKLVIAGDADHEDEYSRSLKLRSRRIPDVVLTGFQTGKSLQELYSHAGLFVLPSYHEGLPIVLLEALSYGSSCLVSDIPANREVGLEEERYFSPGNVSLLAQKFNEFMAQPETEEQRQQRIQRIIDKYNWDTIAQMTIKVYGGILTPDRQRPAVGVQQDMLAPAMT